MKNHAVVLGGSMAGLLAARVLSDYFDQVTIIDRDVFPSVPEDRRGVPQGRHTHGLLGGGRQTLEYFFPGISDELVAHGAIRGDLLNCSRWYIEGGLHARFQSGLEGILLSRALLEYHVRRRVLMIRNVSARTAMAIEGLAADKNRSHVIGGRSGNDVVEADLTVDATGRGSHSPQWLEEIGYPKPQEDRIEVQMAYSTCLFRRRPSDLDGDLGLVYGVSPETRRSGAMLAQEGNRWIVTQGVHHGQNLPTETGSFIEFSRGLPNLDMYNVIRDAEPLCQPFQARFPANVRRRYEKLRNFPSGYLVFGDAISSFNPIYGQGMTVASMQARALEGTLRTGSDQLAPRFFQHAAVVVDSPWAIAVGADLRVPTTVGPRSMQSTVLNWYVAKLHRAAHKDRVATLAFHRVANLLDPPPSIMRPLVAARVLFGGFQTGTTKKSSSAETALAGR
jgi:2-polyprenyl-6-methoxyphenol hydroxylase-like FAD-dependent oxidoreductase